MTDGSWGSYVVIEDQHFLIIDVEGLFSTMRTEEEEILLLSFVTAISDVTIFNTNCAIEKSYTKLFSNLDQVSNLLRGDKIFKGTLLIAARDVN